jgi:hypothetical protein
VKAPRNNINVYWSDEDDCWIADVPDLRPASLATPLATPPG